MKKFSFLAIVFLAYGSILHAQSSTATQYLYWLRYQNQLIFSPKLQWNNEIDNRRFFDPDVEHQLIFHSRLHYRSGKWDFGGGLTYSEAFASKPENGYDHTVSEIRPVIEANHEQPIGKMFLQNRIRIDNRFTQVDQDESVLKESTFVMRFRYRLQLRIPVKTNEENIPIIGIRLAEEIMFNSKKNTFDQNRLYITGDFYINRNFSLETGYLYIYQHRYGLPEYFSRHVIRFSVIHRIYGN